MPDYDAESYEIDDAHKELVRYGVTEEMFDISRYAGCTERELKSVVNAVIEHYKNQNRNEMTC